MLGLPLLPPSLSLSLSFSLSLFLTISHSQSSTHFSLSILPALSLSLSLPLSLSLSLSLSLWLQSCIFPSKCNRILFSIIYNQSLQHWISVMESALSIYSWIYLCICLETKIKDSVNASKSFMGIWSKNQVPRILLVFKHISRDLRTTKT